MAESRRRICIIGGGASGLVSIKNCLDENLIPICYEKSSDIGGLWNYREDLGKVYIFKNVVNFMTFSFNFMLFCFRIKQL